MILELFQEIKDCQTSKLTSHFSEPCIINDCKTTNNSKQSTPMLRNHFVMKKVRFVSISLTRLTCDQRHFQPRWSMRYA